VNTDAIIVIVLSTRIVRMKSVLDFMPSMYLLGEIILLFRTRTRIH
jgi:hypothetical protein